MIHSINKDITCLIDQTPNIQLILKSKSQWEVIDHHTGDIVATVSGSACHGYTNNKIILRAILFNQQSEHREQ